MSYAQVEESSVQTMWSIVGQELCQLELPNPTDEVLPGVLWGAFDQVATPAYWAGQTWQHSMLKNYDDFSLGRNLAEEVAACLLGGFGMPAIVGLKAYERLRIIGLLVGKPTAAELEVVLSEPLEIAGRKWTYRFPRQKARFLAACLDRLEEIDLDADDVALRNQLTELPGIGLKTASWIVRNLRDSDVVAIIDIHILRVCRNMGLFDPLMTPEKDYISLENDFVVFADALGTRTSRLDGLIWDYVRASPAAPAQRLLFE